jgi:hypothetical protein
MDRLIRTIMMMTKRCEIRHMSGNTNMRPTGYRSKFGTTAKTAWEYWNIYCFAVAIGFHSLAKDALDAHFRVIEQELEGW